MEHLDRLCERYTGRSPYFGTCVPAAFQEKEKPVVCKILPTRVVILDARREEAVGPKVSLLVVDPEKTARYLEIRGEVEMIEEGAIEHPDQLTRRYTPHPYYYGSIYPAEQQAQETRIICRIHATKITLDAIHS